MAKIQTVNQTTKVSTRSATQSENVSATHDSSQRFSKLSEEWARSDKLVEGIDYSSKYYAQLSKQYSEEATELISVLENAGDIISNTAEQAIIDIEAEINASRSNSLEEIRLANIGALEEINNATTDGVAIINETKTIASTEINNAKDFTLNEINSSVEGYKSSALDVIEAKSTEEQAVIVAIKDDVLNSTNEASDYKEEAKYWAEKAKDNSGIYYDEIGEQDISVSILEVGYVTNETLNETIGDISTVLDDILGGV